MKNIEGISKNKNSILPLKTDFIVWETNQLLRSNLKNDKILDEIKNNFKKLIKYGKFFSGKINNISEFTELITGFEKILGELEIEKLYNDTTINNIEKFSNLDLFKQFFYISAPLYNNSENISIIKGGTCYHWAIFFYNLFNQIDKKNIFEKKIISFGDKYKHTAFLIGFKGKEFLIDPYSKKNGLVSEIKKGNKLYLGAILNELIFGEIVNEKNLKLKNGKETIKPKTYKTIKNFIRNINYEGFLNIKTYIFGKATNILIKELDKESLLINFNGTILQRDKELLIDDIMFLYMEKKKFTNYDILLAILGLNEEILNKNTKEQIKALASKLELDYLLEKLGISEIVKMFS